MKRMKTPEDVQGGGVGVTRVLFLVGGSAAAFGEIATSEAVSEKARKERISREGGWHTVTGARRLANKLRLQGLGPGEIRPGHGASESNHTEKVEIDRVCDIRI